MTNLHNKKGFRIAISVFAAIMIWLYVENIDPSIIKLDVRNIPVEFIGEEDVLAERGLMVTSDKDVSIDLVLEGQRSVISSLGSGRDIRIEVDLTNISTTGQHSLEYKIIYPDSVNESQLSVVSSSAYRVTVDVVELYKKSVGIKGERIGSPAEGYMADEMRFDLDSILISGKQLSVSNISHALVTVDLTGATEEISGPVSFELIDFNGNIVDKGNFRTSTDTVEVTVPILMIKTLPLVLDFVEHNGSREENVAHSIFPNTVTVAGDSKSIGKLEEIVVSQVDLQELLRNTSYTVTIPIPAGAINLSGETAALVTISFMNVTTRTVTASDISFINEPEGKTVTAVTKALDVVLRGSEEDLALIEDFNIRIVGDMEDLGNSDGNYAIPATVYVDGNENVGAIGTYQIAVRVSSH